MYRTLHRLAGLVAVSHGFQRSAVQLDLGVAVHAGLVGGDCRMRSPLHFLVAVATVHAKQAGVELVAVGHRLQWRVADVRVPGREVHPDQEHEDRCCDRGNGSAYARHKVGPLREDLGQTLPLSSVLGTCIWACRGAARRPQVAPQ